MKARTESATKLLVHGLQGDQVRSSNMPLGHVLILILLTLSFLEVLRQLLVAAAGRVENGRDERSLPVSFFTIGRKQ
jgi:hypothetical protein